MAKSAQKMSDAIYENGVFRPTRKVGLPERSRVRLSLVRLPVRGSKRQESLVERQRKALLAIAGIGSSGHTKVSENPHRALYGTRRAR